MNIRRFVKEGIFSLGSNKTRTLFMALGTTIGIGALTVILCISSGTNKEIKRQVARFGARAIMILPGHGNMSRAVGGSAAKAQLTLTDTKLIESQIEGLEAIASMSAIFGMSIKAGAAQTTTHVDGIETAWHRLWDWPAASGGPIKQEDIDSLARVCVLGASVKRELFGDADPVGEEILIGKIRFKVKGVLEQRGITGSAHDRDHRVVIPITTAMCRVSNQKHLTSIRTKVKDGYDLDRTSQAILDLLYARHNIDPEAEKFFTVITTNSLIKRFKGVTETVTRLLVVLAGISLLVGGLVLMNIMLVSVSERTPEIGLRRAIGANERMIFTQFISEAIGVNIIGLIVGFSLGLITIFILDQFTKIPVSISYIAFVLGGLFSTTVGLVFGVQPARRAARLDPVEALR
jgi:putative ABC transport system permease protein